MTEHLCCRIGKVLCALLLAVTPAAGMARQQSSRAAAEPGLRMDYNRLWDYNLYEGSRLGLGASLTLAPQATPFGRLTVDAYGGYGIRDRQWKYGLLAEGRLRRGGALTSVYLGGLHDYFSVGSRRIADPAASGSQLLGSFMARRMTVQDRLVAGARGSWGVVGWLAEAALGRRAPLFDDGQMLYIRYGDTLSRQPFASLKVAVRHGNGLMAQAEWIQPLGLGSPSLRLLAGYVGSRSLGLFDATLSLLAGATPESTPYIDLFDLGGVAGAPLYIGQSLATAGINEFTANAFAQAGVVVRLSRPLYRVYSSLFSVGSNPRPFLSLKAMWGTLWEADADGLAVIDGVHVQAPLKGYAEAVAGIDGVVRWGVVDFGAALAARLVPSSAVYHTDGLRANLFPLFTASLLL